MCVDLKPNMVKQRLVCRSPEILTSKDSTIAAVFKFFQLVFNFNSSSPFSFSQFYSYDTGQTNMEPKVFHNIMHQEKGCSKRQISQYKNQQYDNKTLKVNVIKPSEIIKERI